VGDLPSDTCTGTGVSHVSLESKRSVLKHPPSSGMLCNVGAGTVRHPCEETAIPLAGAVMSWRGRCGLLPILLQAVVCLQPDYGCETALTCQHHVGTAQHSTAQHSTAQHSTAQHSTAQDMHALPQAGCTSILAGDPKAKPHRCVVAGW
jgi:hypothetical protein